MPYGYNSLLILRLYCKNKHSFINTQILRLIFEFKTQALRLSSRRDKRFRPLAGRKARKRAEYSD